MGIVNWEKLSGASNGYFSKYHSTGSWVAILLQDFLRQERLSWLEKLTSSFIALSPVIRDTCVLQINARLQDITFSAIAVYNLF